MNVVIISAHPDDEILGVGGTLIRHREAGSKITWVIFTSLFEKQGFSQERITSRKNEINKIVELLKIDNVIKLDYPTATLTPNDLLTIIPSLSTIFKNVQAEIIYTVNRSDAHSDHRIVFDAVMSCTKSFRHPYIREVLMYECLSETEFAPALPENAFIPNCYVDITNQLEEKIALIKIYASEIEEHPFPRSERNIRALATYRGASCGVEYAEAFHILKLFKHEKL